MIYNSVSGYMSIELKAGSWGVYFYTPVVPKVFIAAKTWRQPKSPSMGMIYMYNRILA